MSYLFDHKAQQYLKDQEFPVLASYARSGSHLFRMGMELSLGMPSLVRSFFDPEPTDFWGYHTHDKGLAFPERKNLLVLTRDISDVTYSEMVYREMPFKNWKVVVDEQVEFRKKYEGIYDTRIASGEAGMFTGIASPWSSFENRNGRIFQFTFEGMLGNYTELIHEASMFVQRCRHGGSDPDTVAPVTLDQVSKSRISEHTDDGKVIAKAIDYEESRERFRDEYANAIQDYVNVVAEE